MMFIIVVVVMDTIAICDDLQSFLPQTFCRCKCCKKHYAQWIKKFHRDTVDRTFFQFKKKNILSGKIVI